MRTCNGVGRGAPYPLGEHTTTDVVIVCYNYHSAGLRVGGLPQMVLWYICTFGHWHICTLAHLYLPFSPIVVQMGDAAIDALSSPSYIPLSYKWGMLHGFRKCGTFAPESGKKLY